MYAIGEAEPALSFNVGKMPRFRFYHSYDTQDIFCHHFRIDHLVLPVFIVISRADINSGRFQMRRYYRDITERSVVLLKAKAANELSEIGVIAVIEHRIVFAAPIQLNDIIDFRVQLTLYELPCANAADLFILTKQNMAWDLPQDEQNHINSGTVIAADPIRGHPIAAIL